MRLWLLAGPLLLVACAGAPRQADTPPPRDSLQSFILEARFALRTERPNEPPQSAAGRLSWRHGDGTDHVLLATPLGQGLAEVTVSTGGAELIGSDGKLRRSRDGAALLREATGYDLPLERLPAWLLGRPSPAGSVARDGAGRPRSLREDGWRIDYDYESDAADAPPSRVTVRRDSELELRLRIEEWRRHD